MISIYLLLDFFLALWLTDTSQFFTASREAFLNCFIAFSISSDTLRARVPAALLPFSACAVASFLNAS